MSEEKKLEYSDNMINLWSTDPNDEDEKGITINIDGVDCTLVGFTHVYNKGEKLILSYKIKQDPLRFLYHVHDKEALGPLMVIKSISPSNTNFIEMREVMKYHSEIQKKIEEASVPLEL